MVTLPTISLILDDQPAVTLALDVLAFIRVENENGAGYDRDFFGYSAPTGNSCDTRDEVLIGDSLTLVQRDVSGCQVIAGDWLSV